MSKRSRALYAKVRSGGIGYQFEHGSFDFDELPEGGHVKAHTCYYCIHYRGNEKCSRRERVRKTADDDYEACTLWAGYGYHEDDTEVSKSAAVPKKASKPPLKYEVVPNSLKDADKNLEYDEQKSKKEIQTEKQNEAYIQRMEELAQSYLDKYPDIPDLLNGWEKQRDLFEARLMFFILNKYYDYYDYLIEMIVKADGIGSVTEAASRRSFVKLSDIGAYSYFANGYPDRFRLRSDYLSALTLPYIVLDDLNLTPGSLKTISKSDIESRYFRILKKCHFKDIWIRMTENAPIQINVNDNAKLSIYELRELFETYSEYMEYMQSEVDIRGISRLLRKNFQPETYFNSYSEYEDSEEYLDRDDFYYALSFRKNQFNEWKVSLTLNINVDFGSLDSKNTELVLWSNRI